MRIDSLRVGIGTTSKTWKTIYCSDTAVVINQMKENRNDDTTTNNYFSFFFGQDG